MCGAPHKTCLYTIRFSSFCIAPTLLMQMCRFLCWLCPHTIRFSYPSFPKLGRPHIMPPVVSPPLLLRAQARSTTSPISPSSRRKAVPLATKVEFAQRWKAAQTSPTRLTPHSRSFAAIAREMSLSGDTVRKWNIEGLLSEEPRTPNPRALRCRETAVPLEIESVIIQNINYINDELGMPTTAEIILHMVRAEVERHVADLVSQGKPPPSGLARFTGSRGWFRGFCSRHSLFHFRLHGVFEITGLYSSAS